MKCKCGGKTYVIESRTSDAGIRRRRLCLLCANRFTTIETELVQPKREPKKEAKPVKQKPAKLEAKHKVKTRRDIEDISYEYEETSRYRW